MEKTYIDVGDSWGVVMCYDFGLGDRHEISEIMRSFGLDDDEIEYSLYVLYDINSGMTISYPALRMSVVFIGDASSASEWWNTVSHEMSHVESAIMDYYDLSCDGEPIAYLQGHLMQRVVEQVCEPDCL